jgi:threonine synthase
MGNLVLTCSLCGRPHPTSGKHQRCVACGEPLAVKYDLRGVPRPLPLHNLHEVLNLLLPFPEIPDDLSLGEGRTPLVRSRTLGHRLGIPDLWFKVEGVNPTGSFKDRGTLTGILRAKSLGLVRVGTVSTGNMGMSVAAYASRFGYKCLVMASVTAPEEKLISIAAYGAEIVRVMGDYGDLYFESLRLAKDLPLYMVNADDPFRIEGQKVIAYEIIAQLRRWPDAILVPVSSGGNISALIKAIEEMVTLLEHPHPPLIVGVQPRGCNPITSAFKAGRETVARFDRPSTVAKALVNPSPPSGNRVLRLIRRIGGMMVDVEDEDILKAQRDLAHSEGLWVQPDSATTVAALHALVRSGLIGDSACVVCVLTGHGLKDLTAVPLPPSNGKIREVDPHDLPSIVSEFCTS